MAGPFELAARARELSEHAYALWIESAQLTLVAKVSPGMALDPIARLARKSVEVCRLARSIQRMALDWQRRPRGVGRPCSAPSRRSPGSAKKGADLPGSAIPDRGGRSTARRIPGGSKPQREFR